MKTIYVVIDSEEGVRGGFSSVYEAFMAATMALGESPKYSDGDRVKQDDVSDYFRNVVRSGIFIVYGRRDHAIDIWKLQVNELI